MRNLVVHVKRDPYDVYVGRPNGRARLKGSKWANPDRDWTADDYERHLLASPHLLAQLPELRGKVLACWCAPAGGLSPRRPFICHAQVLAYYANRSGGTR